MIDFNAVKNLNLKLNIGKGEKTVQGGDGGQIVFVAVKNCFRNWPLFDFFK